MYIPLPPLATSPPAGEGVWLYYLFGGIILLFLVVDLGILNRKAHAISFRSAAIQSVFWVLVSGAFGFLIYYFRGSDAAVKYYAGYLTEYALSMDNIFVIILILNYFRIEEKYFHKVLFWGILGAVVMRGLFIFVGAYLIEQFHWILYVFGAFLLITGFRMLMQKSDHDIDPEKNWVVRFARKNLRLTTINEGGKFFLRRDGVLYFTPLFLVILLIESTDLIFAIDSIPAIMGIAEGDRLVMFTSNIFAVMGLRAMFFLLSNLMNKFYLLQKGLSFVLIFIGLKMVAEIIPSYVDGITHEDVKLPIWVSLSVIVVMLVGSVALSLIFPKQAKAHADETTETDAPAPEAE